MQNQITGDVLCATYKLLDTTAEFSLDREILLADYDRRIFKILKTRAEHTVTQKYINGNKLIIEGYFRINVFYQPPAGAAVTVVSKKIPFSKQFDLPENHLTATYIHVQGSEQYVNTRAINPTRLEIRGIYNIDLCCYGQKEIEFATAVNSSDVCCDREQTVYFRLRGSGSRQFSLENDITFPQEPEKILDISCRTSDISITVYDDKAAVKGEIVARISYLAAESDQIYSFTKTFLYNQVVDLPGITEKNLCYGDVNVISVTVTRNPQEKNLSCIVTACADLRAFSKSEAVIVKDRFSKKYEYTKEMKDFVYDRNIRNIYKNFTFNLEDTVDEGYSVVYSMAYVTPVEKYITDETCTLKSKLTVSVIMKNGRGEYDCFTKSEDIYFNTGNRIYSNNEYVVNTCAGDVTASVSGQNMSVKVDVVLKGFEICTSASGGISYFSEDKENPQLLSRDRMILYYRDKGERLFDIAMKYNTDTEAISRENGIEGKTMTENKMLFIPAYGM